MKVLFLTNYGSLAAPSRTRVFQYLPLLREGGVCAHPMVVVPDRLLVWADSGGRVRRLLYFLRVLCRSLWIGLRCVWSASRYDVIFIQRVLLPFPAPQLLKRRRRKVIFDFDDAVFTTEAPEESWPARMQAWYHRRALPPMLRSACHAVVENGYTRAYAERFCPLVSIITGPIDTERYRPPAVRRSRRKVVLGWIGSATTERYLELIRGALTEVGRRHPDVRLRLIGARAFAVDGLPVERRAWSLETEVADLQEIDIGLMPLPDDPWTRGKGGYKLLQYLAMGIPVVASPVGINREIVEEGVNGFLATCDTEWTARLETLIADPDLRRRMGEAGRQKMERSYSLRRSSRRLRQILESVANG